MQPFDISQIIVSLKSSYGKDFLDSITMQLHKAIGAQYTFIARIDEQAGVSRTLSMVAGDDFVDNFEYALAHTPCENVSHDAICIYPRHICQQFPQDQLLIDMNIEGYIGAPLHDSNNHVFGLLVTLYDTEIAHPDHVASLFELFAGRISAEIERIDKEKELKKVNELLNRKIAEHERVEHELNLAKEKADLSAFRMKIANDSAGIGIWEWDVLTDELVWDDRMYDLYGVPKEEFSGAYDAWQSSVHPDDIDAIQRELLDVVNSEGTFDAEFRVIHRNGMVRTIKADADILRDSEGNALKVIGVNYDVTEKVRALDALNQAKREAEQANKAKSDFLANMSHEIRTPMNAVLGGLQLLKTASLTADLQSILNNALSSGQSLLTIINDILDYSKIEDNKLDLENEPFSMIEVMESVEFDVGAVVNNKGIALNCTLSEGYTDGWLGDVVRVKQILLNLVSNAVKFTEFGQVDVKLGYKMHNGKRAAKICVADTGIGMSEEVRAKIFERFKQADTSTTRKFGGTGLGMSITFNLIKLMGGTLSIQSQPNQGTSIDVILPLAQTDVTDAQQQSKAVVPPDLTAKRILVAEDNEINQVLIESMLGATKADVSLVENGKLAVEAVKQQRFDLVLMDIQMPEMDGEQAQQVINNYDRSLPIVALTANVMVNDVKAYLDQGFVAHIAKPVDMNHLYGTLKRILKG